MCPGFKSLSRYILSPDGFMKQALALLAFLTVAVLTACLGGEESGSAGPATVTSSVTSSQFTPPANGILTPEQAKLYSNSSIALLLLSQQWIDRLEKAPDTQEKILILGVFEKARDQVCRKVGLSGIKEYEWISSVALLDPKNLEVATKAGIHFVSK